MRKAYLLAAAVVVVSAVASAAMAELTVSYNKSYRTKHTVDILNPTPQFTNHSGGEFLMNPVGFSAFYRLPAAYAHPKRGDDWFESFCTERNEFIGAWGVQFPATVDSHSILGGYAGGSPDPLGDHAAYLYSKFIKGQLAGYHYPRNTAADRALRAASADALQDAIWYFEDELPGINVLHMSALARMFIADALANAGGIGNVRVVNVYDPLGRPLQSVLVTVPAQSAVLLGALGLGLILLRKWRTG